MPGGEMPPANGSLARAQAHSTDKRPRERGARGEQARRCSTTREEPASVWRSAVEEPRFPPRSQRAHRAQRRAEHASVSVVRPHPARHRQRATHTRRKRALRAPLCRSRRSRRCPHRRLGRHSAIVARRRCRAGTPCRFWRLPIARVVTAGAQPAGERSPTHA
eukprot:scaffold35789_cov90-Isochrysis_galbana.AAC.2